MNNRQRGYSYIHGPLLFGASTISHESQILPRTVYLFESLVNDLLTPHCSFIIFIFCIPTKGVPSDFP